MNDALGYIAYALICVFAPVQLLYMIRGRTLNLGRLPQVALFCGLVLLQISFVGNTVPMYLVVGNCITMVFNGLNLWWLLWHPAKPPRRRPIITDDTMRQDPMLVLSEIVIALERIGETSVADQVRDYMRRIAQ